MDDDFEIEITDLHVERSRSGDDAYLLPRPVRLIGPEGSPPPIDDVRDDGRNGMHDGAHVRAAVGVYAVPLSEASVEASNQAGAPEAHSPLAVTPARPSRLPAEDAFDFEVTDLSGQPVTSMSWLASSFGRASRLGGLAARARQLGQRLAGSATPDQPGAARRANRRRLAGGVAALGAVTLALLVVLSGSPVSRTLMTSIFATPTATAVGANTILLANTVPWGQLLIDGKAVKPSAYGEVQVLNLTGGSHEVRYVAAPFPSLRCHLTVPAASSDNCPKAAVDQSQPAVTFGAARLLDMGVSVRNLAPDRLTQLTAVVQGMLNSLTTRTSLQPGDHYANADGQVVTAQQTLRATLRPILNTDPSLAPDINGTTCVTFCDNQGGYGNGFSDTDWTVLVNVRTEWVLTTLDGTLIDVAQTAIPGEPPNSSTMSIPVTLTWANGNWQLGSQAVPGLANPASFDVSDLTLCNTAQQIIPQVTTSNFSATGGGAGSSCVVAANPAEGCVVTWQLDDSNGTPVGPPAYLLYRFGALLVANQAAVVDFPRLPLANDAERALAQQIVASLGQPSTSPQPPPAPAIPTPAGQ